MANINNFEVTSPLSMLFRKAIPIKAGEVIKQGQWFNIDAAGEAVLSGGTPGSVSFLAFIDSQRPDVKGTLPDGNEVSLGGMAGLIGSLEGYVNNVGYDDAQTYNAGAALTVKSGKLTPAAAGEFVFGYVEKAIGPDALLHYVGVSGYALSVAA